jgi:hypothetical protein
VWGGGGTMNLFTSDRGYVVYSLISSTIILSYSLSSAISEIKLLGSGSQNDLNYEQLKIRAKTTFFLLFSPIPVLWRNVKDGQELVASIITRVVLVFLISW